MDIIFEPYYSGQGSGRVRLPLSVSASDKAARGHVRLPLRVQGAGALQAGGTGHTRLPLVASGASAKARGRVRLPLRVEGGGSALAPSLAVGNMPLWPPLRVRGTGSASAGGAGHVRSATRAFGSDARAVGRVQLPLGAFGREAVARVATLYQLPSLTGRMLTGMVAVAVEQLRLGATTELGWTMVRGAPLGLGQQPRSLLVSLQAWQERFGLGDMHVFVWQWLRTESLGLQGDAAQLQQLVLEAADTLALLAGHGSALDAQSVMVSALQLGERAGYAWAMEAAERLGAGAAAQHALLARHGVDEPLGLAGAAACYANFAMLAPEQLALGEAGASVAELMAQVVEGLAVLARFTLPDGEYLAWVCHTEARAFTRYRGFPFNSFAQIGGRYYGATDTGIYALEGDDDAGAPIEASIRGGLSDLGTGLMKRMDSLYLGYRTSGDLVLKVVTTHPDGEKAESWYRLEPRPGQAMHEGRVRVGKGLKSVYWGFELANVDGADFGLDAISWYPMVLERRI